MRLSGKTALVTGGGSGIGAAIALALAAEGCRVVISGRREETLREVAQKSTGSPQVLTCTADVADRDGVDHLLKWTAQQAGPIDILVNSAGINVKRRSMSELSPEDWDRLLHINATGAYNCMRAVLPQMRSRRDGLIINISSVAGKRASPIGGVAYNASKFAMAALGLTVAQEEKDNGIRVTTIFPGEVDTPILKHRPVPVSEEQRSKILQPEDVAAAVLMVACLPVRAHVPELVIKPTTQAYM